MGNHIEHFSSFEEAARAFETWKNCDPFPNIAPALLNSADIEDYVRMTGLIYPFYPKDLSGATYSVRLTGICVHWEEDSNGELRKEAYMVGDESLDIPNAKKNAIKYSKNENDKLVLAPNSITYITLEPVFQVPAYIALRFNLKISHVYRGLLLGTGPIIDPGFRGKLSLPIHNLTSNEYIFRPGDEIISLEFTKMSRNSSWKNKKSCPRLGLYKPNDIPEFRQVDTYLQKALGKISSDAIYSSVLSVTKDARFEAKKSADLSSKTRDEMKRMIDRSIIIAILAIVISVATILIPSYQLVQSTTNTNAQYEAKIVELQQEIDEINESLDQSNGADNSDEN